MCYGASAQVWSVFRDMLLHFGLGLSIMAGGEACRVVMHDLDCLRCSSAELTVYTGHASN